MCNFSTTSYEFSFQVDNAALYAELSRSNDAVPANDEPIATVHNRPGSRKPVQYEETVEASVIYAPVKRA
jgi:hypothetical protein